MFIKYKPAYKKIAMGLLSYMPEKKEVKELQDMINLYEEDENWKLFLWKENDDIIGVLGLCYREDGTAELKHICVNPSYREEGIGRKMVLTIKERLGVELIGCEDTADFLGSCNRADREANHQKASEASG
ncbi:GNAT family N-acetyltransferase [Bacillus piscicola]|uniref:GNAT family N-acetyltransferase n=1 Tax=Bacillus piscicola TaxID=1632684 RepID=UPI001F09D455|nr:GNAT family N-acetyltransferase [Bacillus piscicola]